MSILKDLYDIGKDMLGFAQNIKMEKLEKRNAVADVLNHIGMVLEDTYLKLANRQSCDGNCAQLLIFSEALSEKLKEIMDEKKATEISQKLVESHKVELLLSELDQNKISNTDIKLLSEASGFFIASAQLLRIP